MYNLEYVIVENNSEIRKDEYQIKDFSKFPRFNNLSELQLLLKS